LSKPIGDTTIKEICLSQKAYFFKPIIRPISEQKLCNNDIEFPCLTYKRRTDIVRDDISKVTLLDDNQISFRVFDKNGNGDIGFQILQITEESDDFVYAEVRTNGNIPRKTCI